MAPKRTSVTITYMHPGTQPPIYLAGTFSEPPWYPQEMDFTTEHDNEHRFYKEVMIDEGGQFQYKFRIGSGDWWVLDESASTVTDEAGNRNNLLSVPITEEGDTQAIAPDSPILQLESCTLAPEVVVENLEAESQPKSKQETSQRQESDGSDKEMQEDWSTCLVDRSEADTPMYARTAAGVADSAAILDREPFPAPLLNEETGHIGEPSTLVPEVAETVADSSAIIKNDKKLEIPPYIHSISAHSWPSTPRQEEAPLFAHECLGPYDGEEEPQNYELQEQHESPLYPEREEDINVDDPLLEEFPQDKLSILAHVRSTESRLSEDETNFEAAPASPLSRTKNPSLGFEEPPPTQLNARSSPSLDVIAEEYQEEDLAPLPSPSGLTESKQTHEASSIGEIVDDEPKGESAVFCTADLTGVRQVQSGLDLVSAAERSTLGESTKQKTSIPRISNTADEGLEERATLITNIPGADNKSIKEATTAPEANGVGIELQEQSIAKVKEATHGKPTEHNLLVNTNSEASGTELIEQEASMSGIGQKGLTETVDPVVTLPTNSVTAIPIDSVSILPEAAKNEVTGQEPFIAVPHQNTGDELVGKECSVTSIPETAGGGPAKRTSSTTQSPEAPKDENVNDSAKSGPSSVGDHKSSDPEKFPNAQYSEDIKVAIKTSAAINEIIETSKDESRVGSLSPTRQDPVGKNLKKEEELRADPAPSNSEIAQESCATQTLPIDEIARNESIVDTPTPTTPTPNDRKLSGGESIPTHLAMPNPNISKRIETPTAKGVNAAKSTSVEQPSDFDSNLKMRNPANTERSVTPASLRRPRKDKETRNFLQVLWRAVFIQWIGGFFTRLCGRHRP